MPLATRKIAIIAFTFVTAVTVTGCSNNDPTAGPTPSSTTTIVTPTPSTKTPTEEPTDNTPINPPTTPPPMTPPPTEIPNDEPTKIIKPDGDGEPKKLTLSDVFDPASAWFEDKFDIASEEGIHGIALKSLSCNRSAVLEFRLANNFTKLRFSFGQGNNSADSEMDLKVAVYGNRKQLEINSVAFNEIGQIDTNIESVNALKIEISGEREAGCYGGDEITPVLYDIEVK